MIFGNSHKLNIVLSIQLSHHISSLIIFPDLGERSEASNITTKYDQLPRLEKFGHLPVAWKHPDLLGISLSYFKTAPCIYGTALPLHAIIFTYQNIRKCKWKCASNSSKVHSKILPEKVRERRDRVLNFSFGLLSASHYTHLLILIMPAPISFGSQVIAYIHIGAT